MMYQTSLDIAQLLAGMLLFLVSFLMLYQDRLSALINRYALQAMVLSASVAWQAYTPAGCAFICNCSHCASLQGADYCCPLRLSIES